MDKKISALKKIKLSQNNMIGQQTQTKASQPQ
jgi:hypothetical protein